MRRSRKRSAMNACNAKHRTGSNMDNSLDEIKAEKQLAERVRKACIEAAREGFMDASMSGLCTEGALEAATSAIQKLDIEKIVEQHHRK